KIDRNKAVEEGDRQLNAGEWTSIIATNRELVAQEPGGQSAGHAEAAGGNAALDRRQLVFAAGIALVFAEQLRIQDSRIIICFAACLADQGKRRVAPLLGVDGGSLALALHD